MKINAFHSFLPRLLLCGLLQIASVQALDLFGRDNPDIIWRTGLNQYIKLAKQDDPQYGLNDHPLSLGITQLESALTALEYKDAGLLGLGEQLKGIFTVRQINILAGQLSTALAKATPQQDIIFVLEKNENKLLGIKDRSYVAGRVFYQAGKLNIIIGDYEFFRSEAFENVYDPGGQSAVPYSFNFGKRDRTSRAFQGSAMVDVVGVENKQTDEFRYDWFVIDVEQAAAGYLARKNKQQNPNADIDKALEVQAARLAKQRREMRAEMARMRKDMEARDAPSQQKPIEERIETLDQLLAKKLITQDEYEARRQSILNDI